jgi:hypothetical protein
MRAVILIALWAVPAWAQRPSIEEWMHRLHPHSLPYQETIAFGPQVVPRLLVMLADRREEPWHPNITAALGMLGDDRVAEALIAFFVRPSPAMLTPLQYQARHSALMSLGYAANRGSSKALDFLIATVGGASAVTWKGPYFASAVERDRQLVRVAVLGLGLSGKPAARTALDRFKATPDLPAEERRIADLALQVQDMVAQDGLTAYHRSHRGY